MSTAGPRAMAEGFATVIQSLAGSKKPIPHWAVAPSLFTRADAEEEARKERDAERDMLAPFDDDDEDEE